jgi:hypothetical protein
MAISFEFHVLHSLLAQVVQLTAGGRQDHIGSLGGGGDGSNFTS